MVQQSQMSQSFYNQQVIKLEKKIIKKKYLFNFNFKVFLLQLKKIIKIE